jgi:hypothetical protein
MEVLTRAPGGALLVFLLTIVIAALAFTARTWQGRRPAPVAASATRP